jgi:hypothetical protein
VAKEWGQLTTPVRPHEFFDHRGSLDQLESTATVVKRRVLDIDLRLRKVKDYRHLPRLREAPAMRVAHQQGAYDEDRIV